MLPRLNQCCDIYRVDITDRGDKELTPIETNVRCRFAKTSTNIKDGRGEDVAYDGYLHLDYREYTQKGFFVSIDKKYYQIVESSSTANLEGKFIFNFCTLKEDYAD